MPDRDGNKSPGGRWSRFSRTFSIWILIFLVPILFFQMMGPADRDAVELTYTQFMHQLQEDNIQEVTFVLGEEVSGSLRSMVTIDGQSVEAFRTRLPAPAGDQLLDRLAERDVIIKASAPPQNWWTLIIGILPWILIIGIWLFFFRQMQAGGSKAFQFGKSKAKLLTADTPKVTFADVSGADEAKEELREIIEFLKDPDKFSRLGGRLPKGALLVGPPGTGKTLLAKAVAGEAGRPFFSMSGSDFVEMFVGVGASRVRDLFEQGKANAPCIIFIDEIDAVGRHRGAGLGGGHDEREQTLNQLLVEMDGFGSNDGVILLAATNRPDVLDPALLRPGRFDRQVVVGSPDLKGREGILKVHLRKIPLAEDVNVHTLARGTPGMSGADLANLVNEAALLAARKNQDRVYMQDLEEAKDKVMLGAERKSMVLSEAERTLTAYHEAGHAVVGLKIPGLDPVHKVTIVPRGRALGVTASLPEEDRHSYSKDYLHGQLAYLFGGRAAEAMIFGEDKVTTGAGNDIERATSLARRMVTQFGMSEAIGPMAVGDSEQEVFLGREIAQRRELSQRMAELVDAEVKRILDEAYQRAVDTLEEHRDLLERMAEALLDRETIDREQISLLAAGQPLPPAPVSEPEAEEPEAEEQPEAEAADTGDEAVAAMAGEETEELVAGSDADDELASPAAHRADGTRAITDTEPDPSR